MESLEEGVENLEIQRAAVLAEKKILAQLEREAFSEHKKLEEHSQHKRAEDEESYSKQLEELRSKDAND